MFDILEKTVYKINLTQGKMNGVRKTKKNDDE